MKYTTFVATVVLFISSAYAEEDPWTPSPLCPFPSNELTRFPYEGDCSKYWECYQGARYPMNCPAGLEFNAEVNRCDDPSLANCNPDATIIYPTFPHSVEPTKPTVPTPDPGPAPECPFPSNDLTFYPVANNCSQYWECFQGNRYLMSCPSGLYWNTLANYCDYKENVDCSLNTPTPAPGSTTPGPRPSTTPGDNTTSEWAPDPLCPYPSHEITFFPHPNCSKYYECYEGNKYVMACPEGLYWNHLANVCDYKENVDCDRIVPTAPPATTVDPTAKTTTKDPICSNQPDGTYLPHPSDCSKFYECAGGAANEEHCPGNLLWNQEILTCDYPEHVKCP